MGDMGEIYRDMRDYKRHLRAEHGVACPQCNVKQPRRNPTILLPGQRCKVDGYRDPRPRLDAAHRKATPDA